MTETKEAGAPIDFARLREVSADDAEMMNELTELYFAQTKELLGELKTAIAAQNGETTYRAAHKALGSSLTCGMDAIVPALRELEQAGRDNDFESAQRLLKEAEENFAALAEYLESNREQLSN